MSRLEAKQRRRLELSMYAADRTVSRLVSRRAGKQSRLQGSHILLS